MFKNEQKAIETKIKEFCEQSDIPLAGLKWQPIPFNGEWGISTSFFQMAADIFHVLLEVVEDRNNGI